MISPDQDLFNYFYHISQAKDYETYDYLPMANEPVEYPFVVINYVQNVGGATKTELTGALHLTIDVWGSARQRITVEEMGTHFYKEAIGEILTDSYRYFGHAQDQSKTLTVDTSVENTIFQRCTIELELQII